jgi:hypothetical protein
MGGKRNRSCPAGVWTTIYGSTFTAVPASWELAITCADGSTPSGRLVQKRSLWIFPGSEVEETLMPVMAIERRWINTFYYVRILPDRPVEVAMRRTSLL